MTKKMIGLVSGTFVVLLLVNMNFLAASTTKSCLDKSTVTCSNNNCHANQANFKTINWNKFIKE